jgi:hypothetical protein
MYPFSVGDCGVVTIDADTFAEIPAHDPSNR